jgi:hypothetical protein
LTLDCSQGNSEQMWEQCTTKFRKEIILNTILLETEADLYELIVEVLEGGLLEMSAQIQLVTPGCNDDSK